MRLLKNYSVDTWAFDRAEADSLVEGIEKYFNTETPDKHGNMLVVNPSEFKNERRTITVVNTHVGPNDGEKKETKIPIVSIEESCDEKSSTIKITIHELSNKEYVGTTKILDVIFAIINSRRASEEGYSAIIPSDPPAVKFTLLGKSYVLYPNMDKNAKTNVTVKPAPKNLNPKINEFPPIDQYFVIKGGSIRVVDEKTLKPTWGGIMNREYIPVFYAVCQPGTDPLIPSVSFAEMLICENQRNPKFTTSNLVLL